MSIYEGINAGDFAKSTNTRLAICFCLDTSGSMIAPTANGRTRMDELNEAFGKFMTAMKSNEDVASSADIAIITFGGKPAILQNFAPISQLNVPQIQVAPRSYTPMGEAIQIGLKLLELRKQAYKTRGMEYYQPWLVVLTDGEPEGGNAVEEMDKAIALTTDLERQNKLVVFNVGISSDANLDVLKKLSVKREKPISVGETNLDQVFDFLKKSSDSTVSGDENTDILYGKEELKKGKAVDISEWSID